MSETNGNGLGELAAALAKAQAAFPKVLKDREAKIESAKATYSYKYSDLASLLDAVRKPLSDNGLALSQPIEITPTGMVLHTMLLHSSGAHLDSYYPLASHDRPQEMGSEITYSRRYTAGAILCIASEEDDDGKAAQDSASRRTAPIDDPFPPDPVQYDPDHDPRVDFRAGSNVCPKCGKRAVIKGKPEYGGGWVCFKKKNGCGSTWMDSPLTEAELAARKPVDKETGEIITPPDPMAVTAERGALVTRARKLAELVGLSADEMKTTWRTYCGDTTKDTAQPADVRLYIAWLETRWEAKQKA